MLKIIFKQPNKEPEIISIKNTVEALQKLVGGYFEVIYSSLQDVILIVNEDGRLLNLEPNIQVDHNLLVGNVIFTSSDSSGELISLTDEKIVLIMNQLQKNIRYV